MSLPDAIDAVMPSIMQIATESANHQSRQVVGTGFLVHRDGYALTARHVTEDAQSILNEATGARMMEGLALPNLDTQQPTLRASFELVGLDVVEEDQRHDLSLLRLVPNPFTMGARAVSIERRMAASGSMRSSDWRLWRIVVVHATVRAWQSGYPLSEQNLVTTSE